MLRLLLLLVVSVHAAGAKAQTAEEAVALITQGLEAGRATGSPCGDIQAPKVTSGSLAKYRFDCSGGDWFESVFRQIDGCKFEMFLTMNGKEPDRRDMLDFSKFRSLLPARGDAATMGHFFDASPDFCTSSDGKTCMIEFVSIATGECCSFAGQVPRERVESALSLILTQHCPR
jgi:hypothetical protein